jgi:hypothetical protein
MGWFYNATSRALYPQERAPLPIVQEASYTFQTNESLHRLSYPGPSSNVYLRGKYFEEALWGSTNKTFYVKYFFRFIVFETNTTIIPGVLSYEYI